MINSEHATAANPHAFPNAEPEGVRPISLTLDLTHFCPFKCAGCIERRAMDYSQYTTLLTGTACRIISQFSAQGGKEILLYGGEPTVHHEFPRIVRHTAACVDRIGIVSNGAFLESPPIAEALWTAAEAAEVFVRVSLNAGTAQTHKEVHQVEGFFPRVINGMKHLSTKSSRIRLGVSYIIEDSNSSELALAYNIAKEVGATDFWLRPKTGLHGIGLLPLRLTTRSVVLEAVDNLLAQQPTAPSPTLHIESWYMRFLKTGLPPKTAKTYPTCFYCATSRLVITPPEPGVVWACTYWRAHPHFHVANLGEVPFDSQDFERHRLAATRRVSPPRDCAKVICNRDRANRASWQRLKAKVLVAPTVRR